MSNFVVICFDVCDPDRLRSISNEMENFGKRVQRSLFECHLDDDELVELKERLAKRIDRDNDHIRFYKICPKDVSGIIVVGKGEKTVDPDYYIV